jgi:hypothetical protein
MNVHLFPLFQNVNGMLLNRRDDAQEIASCMLSKVPTTVSFELLSCAKSASVNISISMNLSYGQTTVTIDSPIPQSSILNPFLPAGRFNLQSSIISLLRKEHQLHYHLQFHPFPVRQFPG